jgi:hypothetical protein
MNENHSLTTDQARQYLLRAGKRGQASLELLGKVSGFKDALETPIGKELLEDLVTLHRESLEKISELGANDEDKVIHKVATMILRRWSSKIEVYMAKRNEVETEIAKLAG